MTVPRVWIGPAGPGEGNWLNATLGVVPLKLFDLNKLIRSDVLELLPRAAGGPGHFDGGDPRRLPDTDVLHQRRCAERASA